MDPAYPDSVLNALAYQGQRVGQHEKVLDKIVAAIQDLRCSVAALGFKLDQLPPPPLKQLLPLPLQPCSMRLPPPREPHVPTPERYAGDLGSCGRFLLQCSLVFQQQPLTYNSDSARVAFVISLLSRKAAQWATALWEKHSPICDTFQRFSDELRNVFDHPVQGKEAAKHLLNLRQGSGSVAEYSVEFRVLAAESGWGEEALQTIFVHGLSEFMKDELAARDSAASLDELISLAIRLDNRLRERRREKWGRPQASPFHALPRATASVGSQLAAPSKRPSSQVPPEPVEEPMQLGRTHLTQAERQRRMRSRLGIYCGQRGHILAACPQLPKRLGSPENGGTPVGQSASVTPPTVPKPPEPPDLPAVPVEYHNLGEVFSKQRAVSLPPHRSYDCAIELLPGSTLPSSRLYNLSRPEREAMEKYIGDSLAAGLIRPSSSLVWQAFCQALGASVSLSSGYHPQSNGQTEQANQQLEAALRCVAARHPVSWCTFLPSIEHAHNSLTCAATGREVAVPSVQDHLRRCRRIWTEARAALLWTAARNQHLADRHRLPALVYTPGQKVRLSSRDLPSQGESRKLAPRFIGPFEVDRIINPVAPSVPSGRPSLRPPGSSTTAQPTQFARSWTSDGFQYLVDWEVYGLEERSWVPRHFILDSSLLSDFYRSHPDKPVFKNPGLPPIHRQIVSAYVVVTLVAPFSI
uniref:Gag-protease n=1 Tax=Dicentrarchus labrax TaxID=13489 RepID=E6ZFK7_DICLA|nr:Gag-protease [Dicentrarchus labrax]